GPLLHGLSSAIAAITAPPPWHSSRFPTSPTLAGLQPPGPGAAARAGIERPASRCACARYRGLPRSCTSAETQDPRLGGFHPPRWGGLPLSQATLRAPSGQAATSA